MTLIYVVKTQHGDLTIRQFSPIELRFAHRRGSRYTILSDGFKTYAEANRELASCQQVIQAMCGG